MTATINGTPVGVDPAFLPPVPKVDPPIYRETHAYFRRKWKRAGWVCPELTSWFVIAELDDLSDGERAAIALKAVNSVNHGWMPAGAAA